MWSRGQPLTLWGQKPREGSARRRRICQPRGEAVPGAHAVRNSTGGLRSQESAHSLQVWGEKPNPSKPESVVRGPAPVHTSFLVAPGGVHLSAFA